MRYCVGVYVTVSSTSNCDDSLPDLVSMHPKLSKQRNDNMHSAGEMKMCKFCQQQFASDFFPTHLINCLSKKFTRDTSTTKSG